MNLLILAILVIINTLAFSCYSVVVPFLPVEMEALGVGIETTGYIFASYSIAGFIGSPILGKLMSITGRRVIITIGLFGLSVSMFCSGFLPYISDL